MIETLKQSIVIPCYNESDNIPVLVNRFRKFVGNWDFELILVNNGSTDNSAKILDEIQADEENSFVRVVSIENNIGYGHGIHTGLKTAAGEILAYSHADGQTPPEDIFRAFKLIENGSVDINRVIIKGLRPGRDESNLFTRWLRIIASLVSGVRVVDINGQPKVFHRSLLRSLKNPVTDFSYDTYVLYWALREGYKVKDIEVRFDPRQHGESKWASTFLKKYKTIFGYLRNIVRMSFVNTGDNNNPLIQFNKFSIAGCLGVLVNYGTFYLIYKVFSVYYVLSSLISYFLAGILIFWINLNWTFNAGAGRISAQSLWFVLLISFTFILNGATIFFLTDIMKIIPELSQILTMVITIAINFLGGRFWVFKRKQRGYVIGKITT